MQEIFKMFMELLNNPDTQVYIGYLTSGLVFFTLFFWRKAVAVIMKFIGDNNKTNDIILDNVKTVNDNNNVVKEALDMVDELKKEVKVMQEITLLLIQNVKIPELSKLEIMDVYKGKSNNVTAVADYVAKEEVEATPMKAKAKRNIYDVE